MNQLRPAKHCANGDQNTYCGPAAISTLCDITSEDAALHILSVRGARGTVKSVVGCWTGDVVKVLKRFSLATSRCYTSEKLPTMRQWILGKADFHQPDREATYLVTLSDHFVVVRGPRRGTIAQAQAQIQNDRLLADVVSQLVPNPECLGRQRRQGLCRFWLLPLLG